MTGHEVVQIHGLCYKATFPCHNDFHHAVAPLHKVVPRQDMCASEMDMHIPSCEELSN